MQERIDIDALIESLETPKSHLRSFSKISKAKLTENPLTAEECKASIEENQKFLKAKRKV